MQGLLALLGWAMILGAFRFALDASSHMTAAVAMSGLAIGAGLCFVAHAILARATAPAGSDAPRDEFAGVPVKEIRVEVGGPGR